MGCNVLDIGAGLGFAGFACAVCSGAKLVELSDGDIEVARTLQMSVALNTGNFGSTKVVVRRRSWEQAKSWPGASFHFVIAADVVYLSTVAVYYLHPNVVGLWMHSWPKPLVTSRR